MSHMNPFEKALRSDGWTETILRDLKPGEPYWHLAHSEAGRYTSRSTHVDRVLHHPQWVTPWVHGTVAILAAPASGPGLETAMWDAWTGRWTYPSGNHVEPHNVQVVHVLHGSSQIDPERVSLSMKTALQDEEKSRPGNKMWAQFLQEDPHYVGITDCGERVRWDPYEKGWLLQLNDSDDWLLVMNGDDFIEHTVFDGWDDITEEPSENDN